MGEVNKKLYTESYIQDIADAIREKNGSSDTYTPDQMGDAVRGIESGGSSLLDYASGFDFSYSHIEQEKVELNYGSKIKFIVSDGVIKIPVFLNATGFKHLKIDTDGDASEIMGITLDSFLRYMTAYTEYEDTLEIVELPIIEKIKPTSFNRAFQDRHKLREIRALIDGSICTGYSNDGLNLTSLEYIRFKENTVNALLSFSRCSSLSDESIQSIIDGLATVGTTQTLTLHADVKAKLTETQLATITGKNWTLA